MECVCSVGHSPISFLLLLLRNYKSLHSVTVLRGSNFEVTLYSNPELRCNYRDVDFIVNHMYSRIKLYVLLIMCFYVWFIICLRDKCRVISYTKITIFNKSIGMCIMHVLFKWMLTRISLRNALLTRPLEMGHAYQVLATEPDAMSLFHTHFLLAQTAPGKVSCRRSPPPLWCLLSWLSLTRSYSTDSCALPQRPLLCPSINGSLETRPPASGE